MYERDDLVPGGGIEPPDGRKLRRYRRRWIVERTNAWLFNFRRLVVRYERKLENFRAFLNLACALIALRRLAES